MIRTPTRSTLLRACVVGASVAVAGIVGCAPARTQATLPSPTEGQYGAIEPRSGQFNGGVANSQLRPGDDIALSAEQAWEQLPAAYASLGLNATVRDPQTLVTGVSNLVTRRPLGGEPLSRALECGMAGNMPNADRYEVHLTVLTGVRATTERSSMIETRVTAYAVPDGLNTRVSCATTGRIEDRIAEALRSVR